MLLRSTRLLAILAFSAALVAPARAAAGETILIKGGTLLTVTHGTIEQGDLLIQDGRIAAVGRGLTAPAGTKVIDASGRFVMPGIVDTHSHMGVYPWPVFFKQKTAYEMTDPINAGMRAADAIWTEDPEFALARAGGVTTVQVIPG